MVGQVKMNYGNLYMDFKVNQPMQGNSTEFFFFIQAKNEKYGLSSSSGRGRAVLCLYQSFLWQSFFKQKACSSSMIKVLGAHNTIEKWEV